MPLQTSATNNLSLLRLGVDPLGLILQYVDDPNIATAILPQMSRSFFDYLAKFMRLEYDASMDKRIGVLRLHHAILHTHLTQENRTSAFLPGLRKLHLWYEKEAMIVAQSGQLALFNKLTLLIKNMADEGRYCSALSDQAATLVSNEVSTPRPIYNVKYNQQLSFLLVSTTDWQLSHLLNVAFDLLDASCFGLVIMEAIAFRLNASQRVAMYNHLQPYLEGLSDPKSDSFQKWKQAERILISILRRSSVEARQIHKASYFEQYKGSQRLRFSGYLLFADAMLPDEWSEAFADLIGCLEKNEDSRSHAVNVLSQLTGCMTVAQKKMLFEVIFSRLICHASLGTTEYFYRSDLEKLMHHVSEYLTQSSIDTAYQTIIQSDRAFIYQDSLMSAVAHRFNPDQIQSILPLTDNPEEYTQAQVDEAAHPGRRARSLDIVDVRRLDILAHQLTPDQLSLVPPLFNYRNWPDASFEHIQTLLARMTPDQLNLAYTNVLLYPQDERLSSFVPYLSKLQIRIGIDVLLNESVIPEDRLDKYCLTLSRFAMKAEPDQLNLIYDWLMTETIYHRFLFCRDSCLVALEPMMPCLSLEQQLAVVKGLIESDEFSWQVTKSVLSTYLISGCHYQLQPYIHSIQTYDPFLQWLIDLVKHIASVLFPYFNAPTLSENPILKCYDSDQYDRKLKSITALTDKINAYICDELHDPSAITDARREAFRADFIALVKQSSIVRNPIRRFFQPCSLSTHSSDSLIEKIANPASYKLRRLLAHEFSLTALETEADVRAFMQRIIDSVLLPYFNAPTLSENPTLKCYDSDQYDQKLKLITALTDKINAYICDELHDRSAITDARREAFRADFIALVKQSSIVRNPIRRFFQPCSLSTHSSDSLIEKIANPASYKLRRLLAHEFSLTALETEADVRAFMQGILDDEDAAKVSLTV